MTFGPVIRKEVNMEGFQTYSVLVIYDVWMKHLKVKSHSFSYDVFKNTTGN